MAKTPETGEGQSAEANPARSTKPKQAVAIDLPPSAVSETVSAPAAAPATDAPQTPAGDAATVAAKPDPKQADTNKTETKTAETKTADPTKPGAKGPEALAAAFDQKNAAPAKRGTPILVPALISLVAGGVGGFGAWQVTDYLNPRVQRPSPQIEARIAAIEQGARSGNAGEIPQVLIDRLSRAEAALQAADQREKTLRDEIGKLASGLTQEAGERAKALAAISAAPATAPVVIPVPDANREVDQLKARIGSVESAANALPSAIGTVSAKADTVASRMETLAPRLDQVNLRVETLAPKLDAVGEQVSQLGKTVSTLANRDALSRGAAFVSATGLLSEAFERAQPLGPSAAVLRNLGIGAEALAALTPFAEQGAPSLQTLLGELRAIRPPQAPGAAGSNDLVERLKQGVSSFVEVRRTGQVTGTDDPSQVAIAEQALQRGDLAAALAAIGRLSPERAPLYAAWRQRADLRLKAGEAAQKLRREAVAALGDAASGANKP